MCKFSDIETGEKTQKKLWMCEDFWCRNGSKNLNFLKEFFKWVQISDAETSQKTWKTSECVQISDIDALCYLPFTGALGGVKVWTFFATSDIPISAAFKDTIAIK